MGFYSSNLLSQLVMVETPFDKIKKLLSKTIPLELIEKLPDKWEKIGNVVTIKLPDKLKKYKKQIGKTYADILDCKTVLNDIGGIIGELREPKVEIIYGSEDTETVHKENGIRYKLNPQKIMFSSGNMNERIRMATISNENEIVIDLFSGIGYFTLPIAVYSKPKKIFACEINPVAFDYLCNNITLNDVTTIVEPLFGDNRKTSPKNIADRVIMGYFEKTYQFLPIALNCLKKGEGIIHYHEVCPDEMIPGRPLKNVRFEISKLERCVELLNYKFIKSYAPGVSHIVLDLRIRQK
jgi:tRNA wybutosine-synthesizing protein 2